MGCLRCVPPCSTCSVTGEEPIKQGAEYKKETRSKSIRVCCYFSPLPHSKGVGGGEEQEMMQDTPKNPHSREAPARCKTLAAKRSAEVAWIQISRKVACSVADPHL